MNGLEEDMKLVGVREQRVRRRQLIGWKKEEEDVCMAHFNLSAFISFAAGHKHRCSTQMGQLPRWWPSTLTKLPKSPPCSVVSLVDKT